MPDDDEISSILYLKSLCKDSRFDITHNINIRGMVTANNRHKEFHRSFVIQDRTGGITVYADYSPAAPDYYQTGSIVTLFCNGLSLIDYGGKVVLGKIGEDDDFVLPRQELQHHIRVDAHHPEQRKATPRRIADLHPQDADTYIVLHDVHFTRRGKWCDTDSLTHHPTTTEHPLVDKAGDTIIVRTLGSCTYANEPLPEGNGSLRGILDYFNNRYTLRISDFEIYFSTPEAHSTTCP